jgi:hypothetical protein
MAADGPQAGLAAQLRDALYQAYQHFVATHPGEVSPATATHGVLAAAAHILVTIHGHASPDEEALVSWGAFPDLARAPSGPRRGYELSLDGEAPWHARLG